MIQDPSHPAASTQRWLEALESRDADAVTALYDADATFHPTFSDRLERGTSGIRRYFVRFLEKRPVGELLHESVQEPADGVILRSGSYDFHLDAGGRRETAAARFTFVWRRRNGDWRIVHHHSSARPSDRKSVV